MFFEHRTKPLISGREFLARQITWALFSLAVVAVSLAIGAIGYRATEDLAWLDATHQAAMILTGMGPVASMRTDAGKVFETVFALFSGVVFLSVAAMLLAPVAHRILHRFHLEADADAR